MSQAKSGDTVKVHYTGKLEDGSVFDTSDTSTPLEFTIGSGQIIPGFEEAVIGMQPGEKKTITIPSDQAYGPYYQEMLQTVDRTTIPQNIELEPGMQLRVVGADNQAFVVTVVEVNENSVTLDANHPLAGEDLTFDVELVDISAE